MHLGFTKPKCKSEKTFIEWFWAVLARVRLADSCQISKPGAKSIFSPVYFYSKDGIV